MQGKMVALLSSWWKKHEYPATTIEEEREDKKKSQRNGIYETTNHNDDNDGDDDDTTTITSANVKMSIRQERRRTFRRMIRDWKEHKHMKYYVPTLVVRYLWIAVASVAAIAGNRHWAQIMSRQQHKAIYWSPALDVIFMYGMVHLSIFLCSLPLKWRFQNRLLAAYDGRHGERGAIETMGRVVECEHARVQHTYKVVVAYPVKDAERQSVTYYAKVFYLKDLVEHQRSEEFPLRLLPGRPTSAVSKRQYTRLWWCRWRRILRILAASLSLLVIYAWLQTKWQEQADGQQQQQQEDWNVHEIVAFVMLHKLVCAGLAYGRILNENHILLDGGAREIPVEWLPWISYELKKIVTNNGYDNDQLIVPFPSQSQDEEEEEEQQRQNQAENQQRRASQQEEEPVALSNTVNAQNYTRSFLCEDLISSLEHDLFDQQDHSAKRNRNAVDGGGQDSSANHAHNENENKKDDGHDDDHAADEEKQSLLETSRADQQSSISVVPSPSMALWDRLEEDYREWLQSCHGLNAIGFGSLSLATRLHLRDSFYDTSSATLWNRLDDDNYRLWLQTEHGMTQQRFGALSLAERLQLRTNYYDKDDSTKRRARRGYRNTCDDEVRQRRRRRQHRRQDENQTRSSKERMTSKRGNRSIRRSNRDESNISATNSAFGAQNGSIEVERGYSDDNSNGLFLV